MQPDADAQPNMNPINKAAPKFVASVKNGKLYKVPGNSVLNVLHVWGKFLQLLHKSIQY